MDHSVNNPKQTAREKLNHLQEQLLDVPELDHFLYLGFSGEL
jgi:hypothetical protein